MITHHSHERSHDRRSYNAPAWPRIRIVAALVAALVSIAIIAAVASVRP